MRKILHIILFFITGALAVFAAFLVSFSVFSLVPETVFGYDLSLLVFILLYFVLPAIAISFLPGARPNWLYIIVLIVLIAVFYICWPLFHLRHFGETDRNEFEGLLVIALFSSLVLATTIRAVFSINRPVSMLTAFLAVTLLATIFSEAYIRPGAAAWIKLNPHRFSSTVASVENSHSTFNPCSDEPKLRCKVGENGRIFFYQAPFAFNGRAFLEWYGFAYDPTNEIANGSNRKRFSSPYGTIVSAERLFGNWYLVYGDNDSFFIVGPPLSRVNSSMIG